MEAARRDETVGCDRCAKRIVREAAYSQQETTYLGGRRVAVTAYYCADCEALLTAIGEGEHSAMASRQADDYDNSPSYKADY